MFKSTYHSIKTPEDVGLLRNWILRQKNWAFRSTSARIFCMKTTSGANQTYRYMPGFYNCLNILINFAKLYLDLFFLVISLVLLFTMFFYVYVFYFFFFYTHATNQTSYKLKLKRLQTSFFILSYLKCLCELVMWVSSGCMLCFTFVWTVRYLLLFPPHPPQKHSPFSLTD